MGNSVKLFLFVTCELTVGQTAPGRRSLRGGSDHHVEGRKSRAGAQPSTVWSPLRWWAACRTNGCALRLTRRMEGQQHWTAWNGKKLKEEFINTFYSIRVWLCEKVVTWYLAVVKVSWCAVGIRPEQSGQQAEGWRWGRRFCLQGAFWFGR